MRVLVYVALGFIVAMWTTIGLGGHAVVALALGVTGLALLISEVVRTQ